MTTPTRLLAPALLLAAGLLASSCGESAPDHARYARLHHGRGDYGSAVKSWSAAVEEAPQDAGYRLGRGKSFLAGKHYDEARGDLEEAVRLSPSDPEPKFLIVETWREQQDWNRALEAAETLKGADPARLGRVRGLILRDRGVTDLRSLVREVDTRVPGDADQFWRAVTALDLTAAKAYLERPEHAVEIRGLAPRLDAAAADLDAARAEFTRAAEGGGRLGEAAVCDLAEMDLLVGSRENAERRLGELVAREGLAEETVTRARRLLADLSELAGDLEGATSHIAAACAVAPHDLDLRFARAVLQLKLGHADQAAADVERVASDPYRSTQTALLRGMAAMQSGDPRSALPDLQLVAANAGGSPISHLWLGLALASSGTENEAALASFKRAVDIDPRFYMGHLARAGAALEEGWLDVAIRHGRKCVTLEPDRASGWLVLGEAYVRRGATGRRAHDREADFQAGAAALGRATELDPAGLTGYEALALRSAWTGSLREGIDSLRATLGERKEPDLLVALSRFLFAEYRDDEALECLRDATNADPSHLTAAATLAGALTEVGRFDEALATLDRLVRSSPGSGDAVALYARHLAAAGKHDEARDALRKAAGELGPHAGTAALWLRLAVEVGDLAEAEQACVLGLSASPAARPFHQAGILAAVRGDTATADERLQTSLERFPGDATLLAARALVSAARGDGDSARRAAREAASRAATNVYVLAASVVAMSASGDPAGAGALANDARSVSQGARRALAAHGRMAAASERAAASLVDLHLRTLAVPPPSATTTPSDLEKRIETLVAGHSGAGDDVLLLDLLANTQLARGDGTAAIATYRRILHVEPNLLSAREKLAMIRSRQGDDEGALAELEAVLAAGRNTAGLHAYLGTVYERRGDLVRAQKHLSRSAQIDGSDPGVLTRLGHVQELLGNRPSAKQSYERAVALAAGDAVANGRLAVLLVDSDPTRAETLARRAVGIAPRAPHTRRALALVLSRTGRVPEALSHLQKAVAGGAADAKTLGMYGAVLLSCGNRDKARAVLERAADTDPRAPDVHLHLGMIAELDKDPVGAAKHYRLSVENQPRQWRAHNNLAAVLRRTGGDLAEARSMAEEAVRLSGRVASTLDTLGWVHHGAGRYREACSALREALATAKDDPSIRYHLAAALSGSGDRAAALRELRALSGVRGFPEQAQAQALLAQLEQK